MVSASPAPRKRTLSPEPCAWCDRVATVFYANKADGRTEIGFCCIGFCRTCDPAYEPEACAEHPAGCPAPREVA